MQCVSGGMRPLLFVNISLSFWRCAVVKTNQSLTVQGTEIHLFSKGEEDYISLTDMTANFDGGSTLIQAWLRNKNTVEFLGTWEKLNNPNFNYPEFEVVRNMAGLNRFTLSVGRWAKKVKGTGLLAKEGRYGGTFAHRDIAFEFGSWLSPEFKLYLIQEFQRLKQAETEHSADWSVRRILAKAHYRIHTDAVKEHLIPAVLGEKEAGLVYASEADVLNAALFGMTAAQWRAANPELDGNIRDHATVQQLLVLSSLENQNALLIEMGMPQAERLQKLNANARKQLLSVLTNPSVAALVGGRLLKE